ncbi:C3HC zinc finger-like-domain-containing protein [Collybia nuda]|uniref:C3HC zinc finger-like-domain-containing protein n=1 Tax=Collybia nuda TaxID=64659 RepID=A0A9P5YFB5_9AGAR|nr:C3HC zinc finger-like-domain-containing protein [Collybia nuda]
MDSPQISSYLTSNATNGAETHSTSNDRPNIRITKRKLDDAFQVLDDAVGSTESLERPSPSKKSHTIRSLYTTLAKYGIKSKVSRQSGTSTPSTSSTGKNTPHLTAILNRAASRTRKAFPFSFTGSSINPAPALPPTAEYRPSSIPSFLARLATFKLATYANKPPTLDAVAASKCGWTNDGKDRLVCGLCNNSWVVAGRDGMSRDAGKERLNHLYSAANSLLEKQRASLVNMHKDGCPWKARQCDPSIYRIPLQSPAAMVRDIKINALALVPLLDGVEVKHPLTINQLNSLRSTISSFALTSSRTEPNGTGQEDGDVFTQSAPENPLDPPDSSILVSLFGWAIAPPAAPASEPRQPSLSRASSVAPSVPSRASTPSHSRASSVAYQRPPSGAFSFRMPSNLIPRRDASLLHCSLCQRRVGLWAFVPPTTVTAPALDVPPSNNGVDATMADPPVPSPASKPTSPQRQFDLLKEHRSYCPYVVRSTLVPTLPSPVPPTTSRSPTASSGNLWSSPSVSQVNGQNALEGWRAVLTVVLRFGMGQRQRIGLDFVGRGASDEGEDGGDSMEIDDVKAMVAGVKSKGGKDLLKYVKGLLG